MEPIELETDFLKHRKRDGITGKPGTVENPVDLEPYIDFLEEIEAFDGPEKKRIHYKTEFEL